MTQTYPAPGMILTPPLEPAWKLGLETGEMGRAPKLPVGCPIIHYEQMLSTQSV